MEFLDYRDEVEHIVERKTGKPAQLDLERLFDAYLNDVKPIDFVKSSNSLNESSDDKFVKYYKKVVRNIGHCGFNVIKMPRELMESISGFYTDGYNALVTANYCVEQLKKNTIKADDTKSDTTAIKNRMLMLVHNIDNCALKDIESGRDGTFAILKIKLFDMRNELNTDIKGYIRQLHKYFVPYVRQNIDNDTRIDILGYSINQRSVYITVKLKVDMLDDTAFSAKETASIIEMYIQIFRMFAEQYQNVV